MKTMKTSFSISPDLYSAAKLRGIACEHESFSAYIVALIRMDMIHPDRVDHALGQRINCLSEKKKDAIEAAILRNEEVAAARWSLVEQAEIQEVESVLAQLDKAPRGQLRVAEERASQDARSA